MDDKVQDLACWLVDQYEIYCSDYNNPDADFRTLYRALCDVVGSAINELDHLHVEMTEEDDTPDGFFDPPPDDEDGQPDELQEHADFAQDGYFENHEADEQGFWS